MKYGALKLFGLSSVLLIAGCNANFLDANESAYHDTGDGLVSVDDRNEDYNPINITSMEDKDNARFGYVRVQKSPIANENNAENVIPFIIDREKAAYAISKMATLLPNVTDAATLVTDEEVLVAYETEGEVDRFLVADQVKLTGLSYLPGWYHVYVSDEPGMIKEIESYSQLDASTKNIDGYLQTVIKSMLKAPQGRDMDDNRDANNRSMYEMDEDQGNTDNGYMDMDRYYPGMTDKNKGYNDIPQNTNN
ncbi:YhcN/YlaJ family sporulation lipoprotein [Lottiidibacillus patelloidae]|uniref:YhcN/YlaJ family sporulation lipoprotein n=1 Tax=Lottiidibacillus patelloidae TaxID=2670334 RepID=UPI0013031AAE|nr:YhcN/YlaJ family sporulation lipoprotein [Lottiidibacillus patelloidae]